MIHFVCLATYREGRNSRKVSLRHDIMTAGRVDHNQYMCSSSQNYRDAAKVTVNPIELLNENERIHVFELRRSLQDGLNSLHISTSFNLLIISLCEYGRV